MNFVFALRVTDRHDGCAEKACGIKAPFAVVITGVLHREGRAVEYRFGVREIKAMLPQVSGALDGLPREVHGYYYAYDNMYCKQSITTLDASPCSSWAQSLLRRMQYWHAPTSGAMRDAY